MTKPFFHADLSVMFLGTAFAYEVKPITTDQAAEYKLDPGFFKKGTLLQDIRIATSERLWDFTHKEAAYQFDRVMRTVKPEIAERRGEAKRRAAQLHGPAKTQVITRWLSMMI